MQIKRIFIKQTNFLANLLLIFHVIPTFVTVIFLKPKLYCIHEFFLFNSNRREQNNFTHGRNSSLFACITDEKR